ncbi:MAG: DUF4304 domain-containing protein [Acidimicrobiia bacterium]
MTAQDAFKRMMSQNVVPVLRSHGFQGSGQRFWVRSESHHAGFGVQKRQASTRDAVIFTANLVVVGKDEWREILVQHPYFPARPSPNTHAPPPAVWKRIGNLMPEDKDTWWTISEGDREGPVAAEFTEAVSTYAIPFLETQAKADNHR